MARIAVLLTDDFEDVEYTRPKRAFMEAGHELVHVGIRSGEVHGKQDEESVQIDKQVKDVSVNDFDALFIPGGYSPDKLRVNKDAVEFSRDFADSGKPVLMICHGPQLMITARVLGGRKVTGYKSIQQDLRYAGAEVPDESVVVDRNFVTSRNPSDIPDFIRASLQMLEERIGEQSALERAVT